ncbi:MAG: DUF983 domain-containing protein [Acidobacteriia bacterium]|nr:DUF983 domain-containing protein [Terriglobia bacterium]
MSTRAPRTSRLNAILGSLCPRCRLGPIFQGSMLWFTPMHERCPVCGLKYEREQGYFLGAMYMSYAMAVPLLAAFLALFWWLTDWGWNAILLSSALALVPFAPVLTLFARVLWIHLDRGVDPGE